MIVCHLGPLHKSLSTSQSRVTSWVPYVLTNEPMEDIIHSNSKRYFMWIISNTSGNMKGWQLGGYWSSCYAIGLVSNFNSNYMTWCMTCEFLHIGIEKWSPITARMAWESSILPNPRSAQGRPLEGSGSSLQTENWPQNKDTMSHSWYS